MVNYPYITATQARRPALLTGDQFAYFRTTSLINPRVIAVLAVVGLNLTNEQCYYFISHFNLSGGLIDSFSTAAASLDYVQDRLRLNGAKKIPPDMEPSEYHTLL